MRAGTRDCDLGTGNGSEIGVETYQTAANIHHRDTGPTLQQGQKLASVNRPTAALPDCLTRRNSLPAQTPKRSPFSLPLRIHNHRRRFIVVSVVGTFSLQSFVPLSPPPSPFQGNHGSCFTSFQRWLLFVGDTTANPESLDNSRSSSFVADIGT